MKIKITFASEGSGFIDFNYQHQIQGLIYNFLARSNPDYASWLHEEGFVYRNDKRFKFFVFSGIMFHGPIKIKRSNSSNGFSFKASQTNPFTLSFQIASPVSKFIQHLIDGIFKEGHETELGRQKLYVNRVETLQDPLNGLNSLNDLNGLNLRPLESPIFVKKPMPSAQQDKYLFPGDEGYEELLNQNLIHKYETFSAKPYQGEPLKFDFRLEPLEQFKRLKPKLFKSFKIYRNGKVTDEIKGTLMPFTVSGSTDVIRIGLECGFGQNNSMGCGYVEPV